MKGFPLQPVGKGLGVCSKVCWSNLRISPQESSYRVRVFPLHHFDPMVESSHFHLQSSLLEACSASGADKAPAEVRGFVATLLKVSNSSSFMARVSNSSWNGGWRQSRCHNLWWSSIQFLGVKDQYVGIMSGDVYNSRSIFRAFPGKLLKCPGVFGGYGKSRASKEVVGKIWTF